MSEKLLNKTEIGSANEVKEPEADMSRGPIIEVKGPFGKILEFDDIELLRQELIDGRLTKESEARIKAADISDDSSSSESGNNSWSTIEEICDIDFKLQSLYRPVWAHAKKGLWIGAVIGIIVKAIDTGFVMAEAGQDVLIMWLLAGAALVLISRFSKGWMAAAAAGYFSIKYGINVFGLLGAWFTTALVGGFYGGLLGMAVGTVVGYIRKRSMAQALDARSEGKRPLLTGFAIPLAALAVAAPLHFMWLNPMLIKWLS